MKNIRVILFLSNLLALRGQRIRLEKVKGHSGDEGNDGADHLALKGKSLPEMPERIWRFKGDEEDHEVVKGLKYVKKVFGNGRKVSILLSR